MENAEEILTAGYLPSKLDNALLCHNACLWRKMRQSYWIGTYGIPYNLLDTVGKQ